MRWRRRGAATAATFAAMVIGIGAPPAAAGTMVPFSNHIRGCDFQEGLFLDGMGSGSGSGHADIGASGSEVSAQVRLQTAKPNTVYRVRLIQLPRPSVATCNPGDPGVSDGVLHTDGSGTGSVTVGGPVGAQTTAAWVLVEGPPAPGRIRGDVYSSDFPARL